MKPWEETWRPSMSHPEDIVGDCDATGGMYLFEGDNQDDPPGRYARAKLAAAAPEMARMLLRIVDNEAECPVCRQGVYWDDRTDKREQPHLEACELHAVLRKAGVIAS